MNNFKNLPACIVILAILSAGLFTFCFSQTTLHNVFFLKNGVVLRGALLEWVPNNHIKIQTSDSSIFLIDDNEIASVATESSPFQLPHPASFVGIHRIKFFTGVSIPVGHFASKSSADAPFAKPGIAFGGSYVSDLSPIVLASASLTGSVNWFDENAFRQILNLPYNVTSDISLYTTTAATAGLGLHTDILHDFDVYLLGQFGLMIAATPHIIIHSANGSAFQPSSLAAAFAYAIESGLT
jgi:hypothetical protein